MSLVLFFTPPPPPPSPPPSLLFPFSRFPPLPLKMYVRSPSLLRFRKRLEKQFHKVRPNAFVSDGYSLHIQFSMEKKDEIKGNGETKKAVAQADTEEPLSQVGVDPGNATIVVAARGITSP